MKLEVMSLPDSGSFQADGCDFGLDDRITCLECRIRSLDELERPWLWNRKHYVVLGHGLPLRCCLNNVSILGCVEFMGNNISDPRQYSCDQFDFHHN